MQKTKRPLSFLLAVLMIVSMFAAVPFTASASDTSETLVLANQDGPVSGEHFTVSASGYSSTSANGWCFDCDFPDDEYAVLQGLNGETIKRLDLVSIYGEKNDPVINPDGSGVRTYSNKYTDEGNNRIVHYIFEDVNTSKVKIYSNPADPNNEYYFYMYSITISYEGEATEKSQDQQFVTVDDQVSITLAVDLGTRGKTTDDVSITVAGNAYNAEAVDAGEGVYKYKIEMAPAQIADEIVVSFDENPDNNLTTSIKDYCDTLCTNAAYQAAEYADARALAKATLEYGQAANNVFLGGKDEIADISALSPTAAQNAAAVFTDGTGKVTGASFMALTKPEFRFYTEGITEQAAYNYNGGDADSLSVSMDGGSDDLHAHFVQKADGKVLIEVTGVTAENMDKTITVTVTGLGTITFNGNAFAKAMAKSGDTKQQNLGAALYNYGVAANACFAD